MLHLTRFPHTIAVLLSALFGLQAVASPTAAQSTSSAVPAVASAPATCPESAGRIDLAWLERAFSETGGEARTEISDGLLFVTIHGLTVSMRADAADCELQMVTVGGFRGDVDSRTKRELARRLTRASPEIRYMVVDGHLAIGFAAPLASIRNPDDALEAFAGFLAKLAVELVEGGALPYLA